MEKLCALTLDKYGSPRTYLQTRLKTKTEKQDWLQYLNVLAPMDWGFDLKRELQISSYEKLSDYEALKLHLGMFSFNEKASVRGDPENDTVLRLCQEFCVDGFISASEPVLITQPAELLQLTSEDFCVLHLKSFVFVTAAIF